MHQRLCVLQIQEHQSLTVISCGISDNLKPVLPRQSAALMVLDLVLL